MPGDHSQSYEGPSDDKPFVPSWMQDDAGKSAPQQLVARIKRTCKYYGQTEPGAWFDVRVVEDRSYRLRGNNNNYRIADVALGMRLASGEIVELKDR